MALSPANSHGSGYPLGLTGATAATRYVGGTTTGAPASGTFAVGDFVVAEDGGIQICTVAGSPGTWVAVSGGGTTLHGVRAKNTGTQSVNDSTLTAVTLGGEDFDTDAYHDNVTNNTRLTVPTGLAGYYNIIGDLQWAPGSNGFRIARIRLNGTTALASVVGPPTSTDICEQIVSTTYHLAVADYVELMGYQTNTGALNVNTVSTLSATLLGT